MSETGTQDGFRGQPQANNFRSVTKGSYVTVCLKRTTAHNTGGELALAISAMVLGDDCL